MAADAEKNGDTGLPSPASDAPEAPEPKSEAVGEEETPEPVVTFKTWIVASILSCGYGLSFYPIPVVSGIGSLVAADLGEPNAYVWFVPAWIISITCAFLICGPNSDLLGRRWFLVLGNLVCTVGHIVVACAKTNNQIIAGLAISGFGAANSQMAAFALPELLPNKWRHIGVVIADAAVYIAVILGPVTARYGYQFGTWEWNFWSLAICQGLSFLGLLFFYIPPTHPMGIPYSESFKMLDYFGAFLFTGGAVSFLLGIVWAGLYPSNDPHVVAPLVVGAAVLVAFCLWEHFGNLKFPLTPTHVFTRDFGRSFTAPAIALGVINMFYYSSSILWPQMITLFYSNGGEDWEYATILSLPQGFGIAFGALLLTCFGSTIRRWHWQLTGSVFVMVLFGSLLGLVTPYNKGTMIAFIFLSQTGFGWGLYLSIAITQMGVEHKNLGVSGGVSGCIRFAAGAIATTIYQTVFSTSSTKWTTDLVPAAAIAAGLPESEVETLMTAIAADPKSLAESFSEGVAAAALEALNDAYCKAIFTVAMVSMAFGVVGLIACICCKDVDHKMTNKIEVYLENTELKDRNKHH